MKNIAEEKIKKNFFRILFSAIFLLTLTQNSFATPSRNLTIFAEPNMVLALTKIARLYSQKSNVIVAVNFNSSSDLITNVDSGEPADIFISAHSGWIETLHQKGLVDIYNSGYIASDNLVLVTAKNNPNVPEELRNPKISLEDALTILNRNKSTLILDFEGNSSGKFSNDLIKNSIFNNLKLCNKLAEDKSSILSSIKSDPESYALLLESQVKNDPYFQILAIKKDENIFYQAMVIAGDNMEIAREFLKFLKSDAAKKILVQNGFSAS
ncbi:MAG: molybdate ABC transporter substrate-binding protein [Pseudomonadota bacterium]